MKYKLFIAIMLFSTQLNAQCVELKVDTISIYTVKRSDVSTKATSGFSFFSIGGILYDASNFPFFSLKCEQNYSDSKLFLGNYSEIINDGKMNVLLKKLSKPSFVDLQKFNDSSISNLLDCFKKDSNSKFIISKQKIVAAFFLVQCRIDKGVGEGNIHCESMFNLEEVPIIFDVKHIFSNVPNR